MFQAHVVTLVHKTEIVILAISVQINFQLIAVVDMHAVLYFLQHYCYDRNSLVSLLCLEIKTNQDCYYSLQISIFPAAK